MNTDSISLEKIKKAGCGLLGIGLYVFFIWASGTGCPIKWTTGISCAGCGMTRAVYFVMCLDFETATHYHPLVWFMPVCVLLFFMWEKIPQKYHNRLLAAIAVLFLIVYAARLFDPNNQVVQADPQSGAIARLFKYLISGGKET